MDGLTQKCIKPPLTFRRLNVNKAYQRKRKHLKIQLAVPAATAEEKSLSLVVEADLFICLSLHTRLTHLSLGGSISSHLVFPGPWHGQKKQVDYD